jgi:DNA-binding MarR family transcriptional regulator
VRWALRIKIAGLLSKRAGIYIVSRYIIELGLTAIYSDMPKHLTEPDYQSLAELRFQIRRFLHFSEQAARAAGLEPHQHQLMLALKGLPEGVRPRIGELADRLQIQHHSAVELVNRLVTGGYVRRQRADEDRREVLLSLTPGGEQVLRQLSIHHKNELRLLGPQLLRALKRVMLHSKDVSSKPAGGWAKPKKRVR